MGQALRAFRVLLIRVLAPLPVRHHTLDKTTKLGPWFAWTK
jgi:hypothetical protein